MVITAYPGAQSISARVHEQFTSFHRNLSGDVYSSGIATLPDAQTISTIIETAFWTSLRREESFSPRISIAFVEPTFESPALRFESPLVFSPSTLTKVAPGIERAGIHLCVARIDGELRAWGTCRSLPQLCLVVETVAPGLLVVKHRQRDGDAKFVNVAVIEGDEAKILNRRFSNVPGCPSILGVLFGGAPLPGTSTAATNILIRLAVSMRDHGRGGTLLVVPSLGAPKVEAPWRRSISHPISYQVSPPYNELADLVRGGPNDGHERKWREALSRAVDGVAGLTAIDGATVVTQDCEVIAFGAKIVRPDGAPPVERLSVIEPIEGATAREVHPSELGGTRHISAAQFANDQRDAVALVASQDGHFTIFSWSDCDEQLYAYRVEALLL